MMLLFMYFNPCTRWEIVTVLLQEEAADWSANSKIQSALCPLRRNPDCLGLLEVEMKEGSQTSHQESQTWTRVQRMEDQPFQ